MQFPMYQPKHYINLMRGIPINDRRENVQEKFLFQNIIIVQSSLLIPEVYLTYHQWPEATPCEVVTPLKMLSWLKYMRNTRIQK